MKAVGLIVEYNPLHNGHLYHINEVRKKSNADILIAVISSTFTMRGDLSLFDKFTKAKQALLSSIDLVIELPLVLCMHKADIFAKNAVTLLNLAGAQEIWIGSEENNTSLYEKYYKNNQQIERLTRDEMKDGTSYKTITKKLIPLESNDILGYCYYKAIKDMNLDIELHTIQRVKSNYLDATPSDETVASALAIRRDLNLIDRFTPDYVSKDKDLILCEDKLFLPIKYRIMSSSPFELKEIMFVDEGIEFKLNDIYKFESIDSFIDYLSCKRYSKTRLKRMLIYILLNIKKVDMNQIASQPLDFLRVLGYSFEGRSYLSAIKKKVKLFTNIKYGLNSILDIELKISQILDSIYSKDLTKKEQAAPITV